MRLYQRSKKLKTWWIEYHHDGKQVRKSTGTKDKSDAMRILAQFMAAREQSFKTTKTKTIEEIVRGVVEVYGMSFEAFLEKFNLRTNFDEPKPEVKSVGHPLSSVWRIYEDSAKAVGKFPSSAMTIRKRRRAVERFAEWCKLEDSTVGSVEAVDGTFALGFAKKLNSEGLSAKTRKNILGDLVSVWNILGKSIAGIGNPWTKLSPRDVEGKHVQAFTREEEERIFNAARKVGKDWFAVCKIMRHTGLRYGDVANLTWGEVDFKKRTFHEPGETYFMPNKTTKHRITACVVMVPEVFDILNGMKRGDDEENVFPLHAGLYGKSGHGAYDVLNFREVLDEAGVDREGLTIHSWRDTNITRMAEAGVDKETRKRAAGHTQDKTHEIYEQSSHVNEVMAAQIAASK